MTAAARIVFSRGTAARELWRFGEDELALAVLGLSNDQMLPIWRAAARLNDPEVPVPVEGRRVSKGHVICFACMEVLEGGIRPLARARRRPTRDLPDAIATASAEPGPSVVEVHRLFDDL